jgi:hypothetical protein
MHIIQCSICRRAAAWVIDDEVFCEGHKEGVIEAFGIDHFPIRRLSESDEVFRTGGRFSRRHKADEEKRGGHASKE